MDTYLVTGGNKIRGEITVQGSKNSALPIIAASVLNKEDSIIRNCPNIRDTLIMKEILEKLGCNVEFENNIMKVDTRLCDRDEIPIDLMKEMRSSIVLMGAILARFNRCVLSYPGGCEIGSRPIDLHLEGLRKLGATITEKHGYIVCEATKLEGSEITLDFPSVGATENIMLAATLADGVTVIRNSAREPEIVELQNYLNSCGAKIKGAGSSTIKIKGVDSLHACDHKVRADRIVAGTYLCAAAITGGEIVIKDIVVENIKGIIHKLQETNCDVQIIGKDTVFLKAPSRIRAVKTIKTMPYPGFPTDMQSQMVTLLCTAKGTSIVIENIFENRYKYISELTKMGAEITIEGKTAVINGVEKLTGAMVEARDFKRGASLVLAGLTAEGYTNITGVKYIERGYENFAENLNNLGASILKK